MRGSVDGELITESNYVEMLQALEKSDFRKWHYHDIGRMGTLLAESLDLSIEQKDILLKNMKPSDVLIAESAYFNAIADLRYIYTGEISETPLGNYEIRLKLNDEGTKLLYQISDANQNYFKGEIDTGPLEIEKIDPGYSIYIKQILPTILQKIPPEHIQSSIADGYFQHLMIGDDMDEELIQQKNIFSKELKQYIGEPLNEYVLNCLMVELNEIDSSSIFQINPEATTIEKVKETLEILTRVKKERESSIEEIRLLIEVLQAKLEEGFTPELKEKAEVLLKNTEEKDLNTMSLSDLRTHRDILNQFYQEYHQFLQSLRQQIEENFSYLERILLGIGQCAFLVNQYQELLRLVNDLRSCPDKLIKLHSQTQEKIDEIQSKIPILEKATAVVGKIGVLSFSLFSKVQETVKNTQDKMQPKN